MQTRFLANWLCAELAAPARCAGARPVRAGAAVHADAPAAARSANRVRVESSAARSAARGLHAAWTSAHVRRHTSTRRAAVRPAEGNNTK